MTSQTHTSVLLIGGAAIRRAELWSRLDHVRVHSYARSQFVAEQHLSPQIPILLYEVTTKPAETLRFLDRLSAAQSDLCVVLLGKKTLGADPVAKMLRRGAFDYIAWPCSADRLAESIASGLANRRTFLEVRALSDELARTNQALAHDRNVLTQWNRNLSVLNQLTQTLAGSLDAEAIAKTLFGSLRQLLHADVLGLIRTNPEQLWTWSHSSYAAREAQVRADLLRRHGTAPHRAAGSQARLQLVRGPHGPGGPASPDAHTNGVALNVSTCEVPLVIGPHAGLLRVERDGLNPFSEQDHQLLATVGASVALSLRNADAYHQLHNLALRDPLTEVLNRRALDGPLTREVRAGLRYGTPACLMLLDLDYFKTVNDRLGHMAGDEVLRHVAGLVRETVRDVDSVARYGGEEFAVVLPHTDLPQAQILAERVRANLERHAFDLVDSHVRLTASIGLASLQSSDVRTVPEWIAAADTALYSAKAQGRNRVVTHMPGADAPAQAAALCAAA